MPTITPFLWFDDDLEEALEFYTALFSGSVDAVRRDADGRMYTAEFDLLGQRLFCLNGGPGHPHTDAFSLFVSCADQAEVDRYWEGLLAGGGRPVACGWLVDRFGISWQVIPTRLHELLDDPDPERARRATEAMMGMVKIDVAALEAAADGA